MGWMMKPKQLQQEARIDKNGSKSSSKPLDFASRAPPSTMNDVLHRLYQTPINMFRKYAKKDMINREACRPPGLSNATGKFGMGMHDTRAICSHSPASLESCHRERCFDFRSRKAAEIVAQTSDKRFIFHHHTLALLAIENVRLPETFLLLGYWQSEFTISR